MVHMHYSIDAVARMTGISAFTLRNWEKRYAFLKPKRLDNGFRAYDDEHVEMLRKVLALLRHGARIGDLAETIGRGRNLPELPVIELAPEVEEGAKALYEALMGFNLLKAEELHHDLEARFKPVDLLDLVYAPLLARLGRDWNAGDATLAQEHFASAFIRLRLAPYLTSSRSELKSSKKKAVCATTTGELHEGGLMLMTAHLRLNGWSTYYLGSNLPLEDVREAAKAIRPQVLCLSFTDRHGLASSVSPLSRLDCKVCLGGFGALTFDAEDSLPKNMHLFRSQGREAADRIEALFEE
jgi:methanogenic corrinoid protein MtbC1